MVQLFLTVTLALLAATGFASRATAGDASSKSNEQAHIDAKKFAWSGFGDYRVLLRVDPVDLQKRDTDEMPAQADIDWEALFKRIKSTGKADLRTLQLMQVDPESGRPILHSDYAYQRGPYDRAFRWYDAAIPYEFPEVLAPSSYTDGSRRRRTITRAGYMYNAVGDWRSGKLAWSHTQIGNKPSYYAVYFNRLETDQLPPDAPPTGWLGRCHAPPRALEQKHHRSGHYSNHHRRLE